MVTIQDDLKLNKALTVSYEYDEAQISTYFEKLHVRKPLCGR